MLGQQPGAGDAVLVEQGFAQPACGYAVSFSAGELGHALNCACCTRQSPAADALSRAFRARAMGTAPYFTRIAVLASPAGEAQIRYALATDVIANARYRLVEPG
jgi:hypothetical protein